MNVDGYVDDIKRLAEKNVEFTKVNLEYETGIEARMVNEFWYSLKHILERLIIEAQAENTEKVLKK